MKIIQHPISALFQVAAYTLPFSFAGFGQELDLQPKLLYQIKGDRDGNALGVGHLNVGDVDNDGAKDFLVTSSFPTNARVYSGRDGRELYSLYEGSGQTLFAGTWNSGALGDVNGDGAPDFVAGDPDADVVYVYDGRNGAVIRSHRAEAGEAPVGYRVNELGDLDGDGAGEYIINAQGNDRPGSPFFGAIRIHSGATGELLIRVVPDNLLFTRSYSDVGDLNQDGTPDFALSFSLDGDVRSLKSVLFVSGKLRGTVSAGSIPAEHVLAEWEVPDPAYVFARLREAGDLDGDGIVDRLMVTHDLDAGRKDLVAISIGKMRELWRTDVASESFLLAQHPLAKLGDIDGDAIPDFLISGGFVVSGSDGEELFRLAVPDELNPYFAGEVGALDDLDGDGVSEVLVADTRGGVPFQAHPGRMLVYSLGPASRDPAPYFPSDPHLTMRAEPHTITLTWPATLKEAVPEGSLDMQKWQPIQPATNRRRLDLPGTQNARKKYFRLRYTRESD